jgi:hypothetical protein
MKWIFRMLGALVALVLLAGVAIFLAARHKPVEVAASPEAEALGHEIEKAVNAEAWERTRVLRFTARGGRNYIWDRDRSYVRFQVKDVSVFLDVPRKNGRVYENGTEVLESKAQRKQLDAAYKWWINDTFWLNPLVKLFDGGTTRKIGKDAGKRVLEVAYSSGGVTPGDRYQWFVGDDGRPERWRVWVSVPIVPGGAEFTWERWQQLSTGAWVSTLHRALGLEAVSVTDVAGATTLAELVPGPDPFAAIAPQAASKSP